jgi:UPF0716 protein FxsA
MLRLLFVLFLLVPLIEIYVLIQVGDVIGAGWTIFAVVGTAVLGAVLLRQQGFSTLQRAQQTMSQGQIPATAMFEGVMLLFSGALLLTPGFVTDTIGFALLVPVVRSTLINNMIASGAYRFQGHTHFHHHKQQDTTIIEGEIVDDDNHTKLK